MLYLSKPVNSRYAGYRSTQQEHAPKMCTIRCSAAPHDNDPAPREGKQALASMQAGISDLDMGAKQANRLKGAVKSVLCPAPPPASFLRRQPSNTTVLFCPCFRSEVRAVLYFTSLVDVDVWCPSGVHSGRAQKKLYIFLCIVNGNLVYRDTHAAVARS